jgi:stage V sporulation protein B
VISSALRGSLEGQGNMTPVALSSVVEALVRLPAVLLVVPLFIDKGLDWAVMGIKVGVIISEVVSLLALIIISRKNVGKIFPKPAKTKGIHFILLDHIPLAKKLLKVGLPVSGSGFLNNVLSLITVAITPRRLSVMGMEIDEAIRAYGRLTGMAVPLLYMPMVAIYPIVRVLQPTVANLAAKSGLNSVKPLLRKAYMIAGGISLISATLFFFLPDLLGSLLYGINDLGSLIRPLAVVAPFAYLGSVTMGALYGLGRTGVVMTNSAIGNLARLILVWSLAARWGIEGCLWAVIADYILSSGLDMLYLFKVMRNS